MSMGEEGYVVLGSYSEETRAWDGIQRPKVVQGHYVAEVKLVSQGVGTGAKTAGAQEFLYTFGILSGWDPETEKPADSEETGKEAQQRYWDFPSTIGRYKNLLQAVDNLPDGEHGHYPGAAVGRQLLIEVVHSSEEQDDPTSPTGKKTAVYSNVQNERAMPAPKQASAQKPAGSKPPAPTPPTTPNNKGGKPGGAQARR